MSTDYDRATVELVAGLLPGWLGDPEDAQLSAERVLDHLADAGLLLPLGGRARDSWRVVYEDRGQTVVWSSMCDATNVDASVAEARGEGNRWPNARKQRQQITSWPDGSAHYSPWTEVPDDPS